MSLNPNRPLTEADTLGRVTPLATALEQSYDYKQAASVSHGFNVNPDAAIIAERGKTYGDPLTSHTNIGLSWTGLLQQHYGITLPHAIPAHIVALMMVTFKAQRSCRVYKEDNYVDLRVYAGFAEKFDKERKLVDER